MILEKLSRVFGINHSSNVKEKLLDFLKNYREFRTLDDALSWATPIYGDWYKEEQPMDCLDGKTQSLKEYCGHLYTAINEFLLHSCGNPSAADDFIFYEKCLSIDALLREIPLEDSIILYKGVTMQRIDRMAWCAINAGYNLSYGLKDNFLLDYGFVSTSITEECCKTYPGKYTMKIYVPKGSIGSYVDFISKRPEEREFLLSYDCLFRVIGCTGTQIECILVNQQGRNLFCIEERPPFNLSIWSELKPLLDALGLS